MEDLTATIITLMAAGISAVFGVLVWLVKGRITSLEAENKAYRDATSAALAAYQEREREEAAWRLAKQRQEEREAWRPSTRPDSDPSRRGGEQ